VLSKLLAAIRKTDPAPVPASEPVLTPEAAHTPATDPAILQRLDELMALLAELVSIEQAKSQRSGIADYRR
jgi:hypothetical protein